jgi:hypothetical protein
LIALEAGIAAGPSTKHGLLSPALRADPRREPLLAAFRLVTENATDRAGLRYEAARWLDQDLTADPEQLRGLPEIFFPICEQLHLELDYSKLPDAILGMDPVTGDPDQYPHENFDPEEPPEPQATDPP